MKTALRRWYAKDIGSDYWYVESDDGQQRSIRAHCICCVYSEVIGKEGGDCDLRGLSVYGMCYQMLAVMVRQSRRGEPLDLEDEKP